MREDELVEKSKAASVRGASYTAKDFQLEVLGQLAEMQALTESLRETLTTELKKKEQPPKLLNFDGRSLVAIGAIALSLTGYILQDVRNTSKRDLEIETSMARLTSLEVAVAANTEGRIRAEMELAELRDGQVEIKNIILTRDTKKAVPAKK